MKAGEVKAKGIGQAAKRKFTVEDADADELAKGIKEEMTEHGFDRDTAKNVALDHLSVSPKYYSMLEKLEDQDGEAKGASGNTTSTR